MRYTLALIAMIGALVPSLALAQSADKTIDQITDGLTNTAGAAGYPQQGSQPAVPLTKGWVVMLEFLLVSVALLFLIVTLYGGWLWMFARGNEAQVEKGKAYMVQAVIGLVIVLGARIIVEIAITGITAEPQVAAPVENQAAPADSGDIIIDPGSQDGSWMLR